MPDYLTSEGLAKALGLSVETVRKLARDGKIPCVRITPKIIRFDPQAVSVALEAKAVSHAK